MKENRDRYLGYLIWAIVIGLLLLVSLRAGGPDKTPTAQDNCSGMQVYTNC